MFEFWAQTFMILYDSHTLTPDIWSWQCGPTQWWAMTYSEWLTPTQSSGNMTDFTQWPFEWFQDLLFAQGVYSNRHSHCCTAAQSTPIYSSHSCLKSVSDWSAVGWLHRYIKLSPVLKNLRFTVELIKPEFTKSPNEWKHKLITMAVLLCSLSGHLECLYQVGQSIN